MAINRTSPKKGKVVDIPTAPTIGTATAGGESATVAFTAATIGGPVTTYTALSSPGSITGTGSSSPVTVSGLTAGTAYTFTVRGNNATGSGEYSSASNSITPTVNTSYDSIATVTVGAGGTATITFSSIPSTFKHLQVRFIARTANALTNQDNVNMRFNSDSGANYATHRLAGNGAIAVATAATSQTSILSGIAARDGEPSNVYGAGVIDILDYINTNKYTTIRTLTGEDANSASDEYIGLHSGLWMNTAAVTTIAFTTPSSNFMQYSHFALYGIKG